MVFQEGRWGLAGPPSPLKRGQARQDVKRTSLPEEGGMALSPQLLLQKKPTSELSGHHSLSSSLISSSFMAFVRSKEASFRHSHIHLIITGECFTHSLHSREYIHSIHANSGH